MDATSALLYFATTQLYASMILGAEYLDLLLSL